ncbi:MAG: twin-arginine translocase TatA/TatE family subunit [Bauldia sp.]
MGSFSIWHWLIVLVVVLLLFGRNKISDVMGDVAKGIKSFKRGMADDETATPQPAAIDRPQADPVATAARREERSAG